MKQVLGKSMAAGALTLAAAGALIGARRMDSEEAAVRAALQHYVNGHASGIKGEFKAAMHEQGIMYFVRDGALALRTFPDYYAGPDGKPAEDEARRKRRIEFVDVSGNAAAGKITLEYPDVILTDYMALLKVDGAWRIVAKSFHAERGVGGAPPAPAAGMPEDEAAVRAALQHYFNGHATGSADEFKAGMHAQGTMYSLRDGQLATMPFPEYFARVGTGTPAADESSRHRQIDMVDVTGDAALARVTPHYPGITFTDYMTLLKVDGHWQIVAKTVHADRKR
ncbi:MAG TPA: nuclear transport factor 2 family protein [Gemmatimonadales bacterium]|nr:nuclear transport factor 2 family protein [Gemmatimonadales bacterium]